MKTGLITYNVNDRGRQHTGQERHFDSVALAQLVNSPAVQEKVRLRDMRGYFGHWPRRAFGIEPGEGGVINGKVVRLEPALITTTLRARPDGTIEHEAEFLDTPHGRTAKRLFGSRAGGFSSAIAAREYAGKDIPIGFYGFDYVTEPNYAHNRGYRMDSAGGAAEEAAALFDEVVSENMGALTILDSLYSKLQGDYEAMAAALARNAAETDELIRMVASMGPEVERQAKARLARLDDAGGFTRPGSVLMRLDDARLMRGAQEFLTMDLATRQAPIAPETAETRKLTALVSNFFDTVLKR